MPGESNPLSKREQEILTLVARGLTNQEIARELVISHNTVKVHLRNIFAKLEAASRTDAMVKAAQAGWIEVHGLEDDGRNPASETPFVPAEPPLATWQRLYFVLAAASVLALLLIPGLLTRLEARTSASDLTDAGELRLGAPPRADAGRWESLSSLSEPRSRLALVALGGFLYAIGGEGQDGVSNAVTVYDPTTNGWLERRSKPTATSNVRAAALNGRVVVPGGTTSGGSASTVVEVYDPADDRWSQVEPLPGPLAGYALAVHDDRLYLFGGWNGTNYVDTVLVYDPARDAWERRSPLPSPRGFAAAAPLDDRIVVAGGYDGEKEYSDCGVYYPATDRWEACAPMIVPRGGLGLATDGTSVYAIGGGWTQVVGFNERYDSLTNTWSSISTPIQGEWRSPGVASLGSRIHVVGGWSGDYLADHEAFQGTFRAFLPLGTVGGE